MNIYFVPIEVRVVRSADAFIDPKIPSGWTQTYIFIEYLLVSHYWKLLNLNLLFERRYVLKRAHEPRTWVES